MSDIHIPAGIRIRGEHAGFPLSGEHPDFEFTCHRSEVTTSLKVASGTAVGPFDMSGGTLVCVTPIMLLAAQGHGQTFVVCGDAGKEVYAEIGEQLSRFSEGDRRAADG